MDRRQKIIVGVLFLGLVVAFAAINYNLRKRGADRANRKPAPEWTAKDLKGNVVKSSDFKGQVVFLDFWATWCPPCVEAIPDLKSLEETYGKDGFKIIAMSVDDDAETVEKWAAAEKVTFNYQVVMAEKEVIDAYAVDGFPTTFIIDRDGKIAAIWRQAEDKEVYVKAIEPLLKETAAAK